MSEEHEQFIQRLMVQRDLSRADAEAWALAVGRVADIDDVEALPVDAEGE